MASGGRMWPVGRSLGTPVLQALRRLTEKFSRAMYMEGGEQLVGILNHHLSGIVETVLLYGGDILKFAGDALLALWKVERTQLKSIITLVIRCSLKIHQLFRLKESEEGLKVHVKIGLAAGHISMLVFGDEARDFFLVTGQTVDDVRRAQDLAQVNDVVLSPNCWQLCDRSMVEIERIPDARAVKVLFLKPPSTFNFDEFFRKCMTFIESYPSSDNKNLLQLACSLESDPELELSLQKSVMESIWKQDWWYISCQQTEEDQWRHTILSLLSWEEIASGKVNTEAIQKSKFLMRVNLLDDPFR
ncbi:adenylate cyclase type 10-like [Saccopteryx bilineata]|uniref:adenylate cyclase type 10-like n=1 Tax=Saccopteryx bilineata TaxID=59482 RepID=UPI00338F5FAA